MRGKDVVLSRVGITYPNGFTAVHPTDVTVKAGEFFSILGPSGCGKTTILRAVSGFVQPTEGRVLIGGEDQAGKPPNQRPTALIFQNLALFPLMSVRENVAFGLEARGMPRRQREARADELLSLVALADQAAKKPTELSGGQRQRVAIARALAVEPAVLLLDEPLSALDLKLRQHMRAELRAIQREVGVTFIYITHDQSEALTMSDRIAVMNAGRIEQVGTGDEVYANPASAFAASFVGEVNTLPGKVDAVADGHVRVATALGGLTCRNPQSLAPGADCLLFVRPEALLPVVGPAPNRIETRLLRRDLEGPFVSLHLQSVAGGVPLVMQQPNRGGIEAQDGMMAVAFDPAEALALPPGALARTGVEEAA